jgi:Uncharacterized membrane protein
MDESLRKEHESEEIRKRLAGRKKSHYLGDAVLGAIDGCVTTFAVVSGVVGGELPAAVALLLGSANLLADGFSMAVSNFQKAKSERELIVNARRREEMHIDQIPEGEKEEVRQIFEGKGFKEPVLSEVVKVITQNRKLWVNTMLTEELGLPLQGPNAFRAAASTFFAFIGIGTVPLLPFIFSAWITPQKVFLFSALLTGCAFFLVGLLKGVVLKRSLFFSALETLLVGGAAAFLAFWVATALRGLAGRI